MLSFSLLLLVCLAILTLTFVLFFFVWVSLPELAYARLTDAALPTAAHVRSLQRQGKRFSESVQELRDLARERGMRFLLIAMPDAKVIADTEEAWTGEQVRLNLPPPDQALPRAFVRGRVQGPDRKLLFYVAVPLQEARGERPRRVYLALTMTWLETARPFIGSLLWSVLFSGAIAFVLSILLALWLARSLSRPLQRAAAAAERVAAGDYAVSLDIAVPDEARRLAQSFNTMTRAVEASQRSQRDFVANVSHELKTPLTCIQGFAQAILDGTASDGPSVQRAASVIHSEADRLSHMVYKLLDLTRLESGEVSMSWSRLDLTTLLRACADRFALLADEKSVQLLIELPEAAHITGDGDRLMQVFTNLVDNALKHTDAGGKITLSIGREETDDRVSVTVTDTGVGIPAEELPRIFERFYQVDKSRSRDTKARSVGTGLGLAIASEIVRAHSGHIHAESIVDVGTRFTVSLPRTPVPA
jgi:signal transduction histidine kinase